MGSRTAALALLAALAWAQDGAKQPNDAGDAAKTLACAGHIAKGEPDLPALGVRIREGGVLEVKVGDEWKETTLDDLAARLKAFAEEQDRELRKVGKSAFEQLPGGKSAPALFVSIETEPTVPWQHIEWVMDVAVAQKYRKLQIRDGTRRLLVSFPVDRGLNVVGDPLEIRLSVHVICRSEVAGDWGDLKVLRPTEVRYKIGDEETGATQDVRAYVKKGLAAAQRTPNAAVSGEVKAGHKVPAGGVLEIIDTYEKSGLPEMHFYGVRSAPEEVSKAARLPYPLKNYGQ